MRLAIVATLLFSLVLVGTALGAPGDLDTTFGGDGKVTTPIGLGSDEGYAPALRPNARSLGAGFSDNGSNNDVALARYTATGALDTTFGGGDGKVTTPIGTSEDRGHALAVQPNGRILVAGYSRIGSNDD